MRPAQALLQDNLILADGAMGTYFAQISTEEIATCEAANLSRPDLIRRIHRQYLDAGARLLRTNTYAAVSVAGPEQPDQLRRLIRQGYEIAADCAGPDTFVAADLGPAYGLDDEQSLAGNLMAIETFLSCQADLFLFETFADPAELLPLVRQLRLWAPQVVVLASFALSPDGLTRKGIPLSQVAEIMEGSPEIDIWGLNCGIGPTHLAEQVHTLSRSGKPLTLMPNSGYPRLEHQRLVFGSAPDYFARVVAGLADTRVRILGGCCGTTPRHVAALARALGQARIAQKPSAEPVQPQPNRTQPRRPTPLTDKLSAGIFTVVCELDPPRDSQLDTLIASAGELAACGIDALTLADSPMSRVRLDPIVCAARLHRETAIPVLPHLCCRDRNANALRASLLALHSEGIRQVLAITGDAIPESERGFVKPVFNLSSIGLLQMISQMNLELFRDDPLHGFAAVDPGAPNQEAEYTRVCRKRDAGASVFLTQPVFDGGGLALIRRMRSAGLKVLVGLLPLVSYRNAQFLSHEIPGIRIPQALLDRFTPDLDRATARANGIAIAAELAEHFRADADGFYLIAPFNSSSLIAGLIALLRQNGILPSAVDD
jgi:homocysteine S-methyltransferase